MNWHNFATTSQLSHLSPFWLIRWNAWNFRQKNLLSYIIIFFIGINKVPPLCLYDLNPCLTMTSSKYLALADWIVLTSL